MAGTLAQTIQGEAGSNPANQFAVAATIYNRMQAGTFPGGSDPIAIVNAPEQYIGSSTPNASAEQLASAIQNGTLSQYGNVGNAVNFQSNQNVIAGGTNIGGNYFSDNFGPPTANFVAPQYGGAGSTTDLATMTPDQLQSAVDKIYSPNAPGGAGSQQSWETYLKITAAPTLGGQAAQAQTAEDTAKATTGAGQAVQGGLGTLSTGIQTAEQNAQSALGDLFVRFGFVGLALLTLAGAFVFYTLDRKGVVSTV